MNRRFQRWITDPAPLFRVVRRNQQTRLFVEQETAGAAPVATASFKVVQSARLHPTTSGTRKIEIRSAWDRETPGA